MSRSSRGQAARAWVDVIVVCTGPARRRLLHGKHGFQPYAAGVIRRRCPISELDDVLANCRAHGLTPTVQEPAATEPHASGMYRKQ